VGNRGEVVIGGADAGDPAAPVAPADHGVGGDEDAVGGRGLVEGQCAEGDESCAGEVERIVDLGGRGDLAPRVGDDLTALAAAAPGYAHGCDDPVACRDDPLATTQPGQGLRGGGVRQQIIDGWDLAGLRDQAD